jgi:NAD(P)-dependent dehydrogenase (short-subunit alcohol dehydrogenase family)
MVAARRFEGKVAFITGGGSGFGRACGLRLAAEGAAIGIADVDPERARSVRQEIESKGGRAVDLPCDVAIAEDCERAVARTVDAFGRLDMLVTSAGIHGGGRTVVDTPPELFDRVVGIDLRGAYLAAKFAVPRMQKSGAGAIVHIASIGGLRGSATGMSFQAAKGGLVHLTRHMAVAHAAENIRVNCVCPGVVRTALTERWLSDPDAYRRACAWHPMERIGTVDEVAGPIVFLLSDEASFITGAILPIDGGYAAAGLDRA